MKRIKTFAVAAILCATAYSGYLAYQEATMSDQERMLQANIEALTRIEIDAVEIVCSGGNSGKCFKLELFSIPLSDNCYADCEYTGMQDDYCSGFIAVVVSCLLNLAD